MAQTTLRRYPRATFVTWKSARRYLLGHGGKIRTNPTLVAITPPLGGQSRERENQ
ncbi:hypothetical protein [Streptomyces prunicolor]|uniref:hypothetical protein n=1 Tax=Streptomyces prunicolor TaxID=67348 RepID=UPI003444EF78